MSIVDPVKHMVLFQDIDFYTFPYSEMMSQYGTKSKAIREKMRKLNDKFENFIDNSEELKEIVDKGLDHGTGKLT